PMILHGDELGRTQHGNNNTYAQDSELSWVHWDRADTPLIEFTAAVTRLRKQHPTFRRAHFFDGRPVRQEAGEPLPDIVWLNPDGAAMGPEDWDAGFGRALGVFLNGEGISGRDARGERITDLSFVIYFNAHDDIVNFTLPGPDYAQAWETVVDTAGAGADSEPLKATTTIPVAAKAIVVLRAYTAPDTEPDHSVAASLIGFSSRADGGAEAGPPP
ncbi:MAG: glycogen debranching enzyme, partial [Ilumatobacteraceae bacterium]